MLALITFPDDVVAGSFLATAMYIVSTLLLEHAWPAGQQYLSYIMSFGLQ